MDFLNAYPRIQNVYKLSELDASFEEAYLRNRQMEGRVYDDQTVKLLPTLPTSHAQHSEWDKRFRSCQRVEEYLHRIDRPITILEIGCGNGWFSNRLASAELRQVLGVDINMKELAQASRLFSKKHLHFAYSNVFDGKLPRKFFDLVVLNSAVQYFSDLSQLLTTLLSLLSNNGEIHILDSPIYKKHEVEKANLRSHEYYDRMNAKDMIPYYFHHTWQDLKMLDYSVLYDPQRVSNKLRRRFIHADTPFPWIVLKAK